MAYHKSYVNIHSIHCLFSQINWKKKKKTGISWDWSSYKAAIQTKWRQLKCNKQTKVFSVQILWIQKIIICMLLILTSSRSLLIFIECTTPLVSILFLSHSSLSLSICCLAADTLRFRRFSICSSLRAMYSADVPAKGSDSSVSPSG